MPLSIIVTAAPVSTPITNGVSFMETVILTGGTTGVCIEKYQVPLPALNHLGQHQRILLNNWPFVRLETDRFNVSHFMYFLARQVSGSCDPPHLKHSRNVFEDCACCLPNLGGHRELLPP